MIIVNLSSGLGNQLFMYSLYKYIEKKVGISPFFDDVFFNRDKLRESELSIIFPDYPVMHLGMSPFGKRKRYFWFYNFLFNLLRKPVIIKDTEDDLELSNLDDQKLFNFYDL